MKKAIEFLFFIAYSTYIFFSPNNNYILIFIGINIFLMIITKARIKIVVSRMIKIFSFILFTFVINCLLDNIQNAIWIGIKLCIVCNITILYGITTSIAEIADTITLLCTPLKMFKVKTHEIKLLVSISLSMFPILEKELLEIRESSIAKNMKFNITNTKNILYKFCISIIKRVTYIEESLIAKGYEE